MTNFTVMAVNYARGCYARKGRQAFFESLTELNRALGAEIEAAVSRDPDQLVSEFIQNGGDWHALVAAVNRQALTAATIRKGE